MTNHKILLVDDDRDVLEMLLSIFRRAGYTNLITAASGAEMAGRTPKSDRAGCDDARHGRLLGFERDTPHKPGPCFDADRPW